MRNLFNRLPGKFVQYLGLAWFFSVAGYICILLMQANPGSLFIFSMLKKTLDMYVLIFLIFAVYDFIHKPVAIFWLRYSLILLLLAIVMAQYPLAPVIILLPLSVYQGILTASLCYAVAVKWTAPMAERGAGFVLFLLFGAAKTIFPYQYGTLNVIEVFLSLLLIFYITVLFIFQIYNNYLKDKGAYRTIGENTADIIFDYRLQPAPYFSYISPAAETMTGYSLKEFYNNANLFEELTVNSDRAALRELFIAQGQEIQIVQWQKKNGDYIWVEFHNSYTYEKEELISVEGIIRDITEWRLAEEELMRSKEAKQILFSYISHELKTPVTTILGYAKALESNVIEGSAKNKEAVSLIASKSLMLQRLIEDLIQLSKIESNQFSFNFTEVSVIDFFNTMAGRQKIVIESRGLRLEQSISRKASEGDKKFIADTERMEQVFDNLVSNALKFTPADGEIHISCDLDHTRKNAVFEVRDTGMGISAKTLPFIFEIYYKDDRANSSNPEGRGLGLSIAREIIKRHHGDIFAESKEGKGSRFIIIVPLYTQSN